jgi:sugar O-acyltransferase (sialic acid O-acetyltransferase NeuD family)
MKDPLCVIGAGGYANDILDICNSNDQAISAFLVDKEYCPTDLVFCGRPIIPNIEETLELKKKWIIGIGDPQIKSKMYNRLIKYNYNAACIIHKSVIKGTTGNIIALGVSICAGAIFSNNVTLYSHVTINLGCTIGHDVAILPFATISPGVNISGNVRIGEGAFIGTGAAILEGLNIGKWSRVGAGAVVTKHVPPNTTVVGVPAQVVKEREEGWHLG